MAEVTYPTEFTTFAQMFFSAGHPDVQIIDRSNHRSGQKRYWAQLVCSRLIESGLPGTDLATDYVYGKYIRDLSTGTIKQSSRVILGGEVKFSSTGPVTIC